MDKITIYPELRDLIKPHTTEERDQLKANIIEAGEVRDALLVWRNGEELVLVDGHNRYQILEELNFAYPCQVKEMPFDNLEAVIDTLF